MRTDDRLDEGFELLRACSREQAPIDLDLEERMMKELAKLHGPRRSLLAKMTAAALLVVLLTGAAAATGKIGAIVNWTGFFETPDGSAVYVENGRAISGEVNFQGMMHEIKDGKMLDENGNDIGTVELWSDSE